VPKTIYEDQPFKTRTKGVSLGPLIKYPDLKKLNAFKFQNRKRLLLESAFAYERYSGLFCDSVGHSYLLHVSQYKWFNTLS